MAEVMLKSKTAKFDRQQLKEADEDVRRELDEELDEDLRGMLMQVPSALRSSKEAATADRQTLVGGKKYELDRQLRELQTAAGPSGADVGASTDEQRGTFISDSLTPGAASLIAMATGNSPAVPAAPAAASSSAKSQNKKPADTSYDAVFRELAFERRAKPSDRLKTEEELAAEEAERLRDYERARLRRMRGDEDEEGDEEGEDTGAGSKKRKRKAPAVRSADGLDDDFELDGITAGEAYGLGKGLAVEGNDMSEDDEEEEEEADEEASGKEDEEAEEDEEDDEHNYNDLADLEDLAKPGEDLDSDEEEIAKGKTESLIGGDAERTVSKKSSSGKATSATAGTSKLPYTFPCPVTHENLLDLIEKHAIATRDVPTVIKRIRTLYHASLAEDNKHKLQNFLRVLVDHTLYVAGQAQSLAAEASSHAKPEALESILKENIGLLNTIVPHIFDMSKTYTATSSQIFVSKLALMHRNLTRGLAASASSATARTWPSFPELSLLRITGVVWPTSDRQHPVSTPMMILIAQYLAHCRIRLSSAISDLASGLYLCTLIATFENESKRIVPEAVNFLHHAIALLTPLTGKSKQKAKAKAAEYGIPNPDFDVEELASLRLPTSVQSATSRQPSQLDASVALLPLLSFHKGSKSAEESRTARVQLLSKAVALVDVFAQQYSGSDSFVELLTPTVDLLTLSLPHFASSAAYADLQKQASTLVSSLEKRIGFARGSRRALRLQAHRALAIASYVPKFEQSGYNPRNRFDPDTERAEHTKLKALLKKERKGAVRELRRDAQYIAQVRDQQRQEEDKGYKKKMDKIMSELQTER